MLKFLPSALKFLCSMRIGDGLSDTDEVAAKFLIIFIKTGRRNFVRIGSFPPSSVGGGMKELARTSFLLTI